MTAQSPDPADALASCVRPLSATRLGGVAFAIPGDGLRMVVASSPVDRAGLMQAVATLSDGPVVTSRSATSGWRAAVLADDGLLGLDIETVARVALNADVADDWLAESERRCVAAALDPVLELGCCWVLKEAYGKALGVGLALPLDELAFRGRDGEIVLDGPVPGAHAGWWFALYRHADTLIGMAHRPVRRCRSRPPAGTRQPLRSTDTGFSGPARSPA